MQFACSEALAEKIFFFLLKMTSLKDRLLEMFGPSLLAKFREAYISCAPRRRALPSTSRPSLSRQLSLGSATAAYRQKNADGRLIASKGSLLGACVEAIVVGMSIDPRRYGQQLHLLPPDLVQLILDGVVAAASLNDATTRCFRGLCVFELHLNAYPGVRNGWLSDFTGAQLTVADLRSCTKVRCAAKLCSQHMISQILGCLLR